MAVDWRAERWWLMFNAVALAGFLAFASATWTEPELKDVQVATGGEGAVWMLTALPVLLAALFVDLVWLGLRIAKGIRTNHWRSMMIVMAVAAVWGAVVLVDQFRH